MPQILLPKLRFARIRKRCPNSTSKIIMLLTVGLLEVVHSSGIYFTNVLEPAALQWVTESSHALNESGIRIQFTTVNQAVCVSSHKILRNGSELETLPNLNQFEFVDEDNFVPGAMYQYQLRVVSSKNNSYDSAMIDICSGSFLNSMQLVKSFTTFETRKMCHKA